MNLLDAPDRFLNATREEPTRTYRLKNSRDRERARAAAANHIITGRCAHCGLEWTGRLEDEREWFTRHHCDTAMTNG